MNAMTQDTTTERRAWRNTLRRKICSRTDFNNNAQYVHTPYDLCYGMAERLDQYGSLHEAQTFLTFNLEFVDVLCYSMGIEKSKVWFITECLEKAAVASCHPRYKGINVVYADYLTWSNNNMKFDVICGNPPYNGPREKCCEGRTIWPDFVKQSFTLLTEGGHLCLVHPNGWRKPEHELWNVLTSKQICYLSMHTKIEGVKVFGAATRYDWYILRNVPCNGESTVETTTKKIQKIDLRKCKFLASACLDELGDILAKDGEATCDVIPRNQVCNSNREHMSKNKTHSFQYPCVWSLNSEAEGGMQFMYSSNREKSKIDLPKVIMTDAEILRPVNDYHCKYGMGGHVFGIRITSKKEGDLIVAAINTPKFQQIVAETKWGNYQTEWHMFEYFKRDFWKHFVDENGNELK